MSQHKPPRLLSRRARDRFPAPSYRKRGRVPLLLVLSVSLIIAGCGSYASQAGKYLSQGRSQVLGSAYTLERFGDGEVSTPFLQASLQQDATAIKSTAQSISSLKAPPGAREEHQRQVAAIYRAQRLVQGMGQRGVDPGTAPELAQKLRGIAKELQL